MPIIKSLISPTCPAELERIAASPLIRFFLYSYFQLGCLDPLTTPQWTQHTHTHTHRSPDEASGGRDEKKDEATGGRQEENDAQHQSGEHAAAGWTFFLALSPSVLSLYC
jgi:hypothetical protein